MTFRILLIQFASAHRQIIRDPQFRIIGYQERHAISEHTPRQRMIVLPAGLSHRPYVVTRPPFGEFRTDRLEAFDQLDKIAVADVAPVIDAKPGEHVLAPRRPIDEQGAQRSVGEEKPNHISLVCGHLLEIEKKARAAWFHARTSHRRPMTKAGIAAL